MYSLVNGNPVFYIGKINGVGYTSDEEKTELLERFKDEKITDEKIEVDKTLKEKAIELGKLQLTYSKSEFMKYLNGKKPIPGLEVERLREENELLQLAIMEIALANEERTEETELAIAELTNLIGEVL